MDCCLQRPKMDGDDYDEYDGGGMEDDADFEEEEEAEEQQKEEEVSADIQYRCERSCPS